MSLVELCGGVLLARFERDALVFQLENGRLLSFPERLTEVVAGLMRGERASDLEQRYALENGTPRYRSREIIRAASRSFSGTATGSATMRVDGKLVGRELGRVRVHHLSSRTIEDTAWKAALSLCQPTGTDFSQNISELEAFPAGAVTRAVLSLESEHPPAEWVRLFYAIVAQLGVDSNVARKNAATSNSRRAIPPSANDQRR